MTIQSTASNLVITLPKGVISLKEVQEILDYFRYRELLAKSKATATEIEGLSEEINDGIAARRAEFSPFKL